MGVSQVLKDFKGTHLKEFRLGFETIFEEISKSGRKAREKYELIFIGVLLLHALGSMIDIETWRGIKKAGCGF